MTSRMFSVSYVGFQADLSSAADLSVSVSRWEPEVVSGVKYVLLNFPRSERFPSVTSSRTQIHARTHTRSCMPLYNKLLERNPNNANHVSL